MKKRDQNSRVGAPIIRIRFMVIGMVALALLIAGPLLLVWKQAYITSSSVTLEAMSDTLSALNKRIATFRLQSERLSSTERIEKYARTVLHLEYPSSDRISILSLDGKNDGSPLSGGLGLSAATDRPLSKGGQE
jgi:hypothetical protein